MTEASISLQVLPGVKSQKEMLRIIDMVIGLIQKSGISYQVGPMETVMEGELDKLLDIVGKAQKLCIEKGANSVFSNVKILYNPRGVLTIKEKTGKYPHA